jgi:hypothetical protein
MLGISVCSAGDRICEANPPLAAGATGGLRLAALADPWITSLQQLNGTCSGTLPLIFRIAPIRSSAIGDKTGISLFDGLFSGLFTASSFDLHNMLNSFPAEMENIISFPVVGHVLGVDRAADGSRLE